MRQQNKLTIHPLYRASTTIQKDARFGELLLLVKTIAITTNNYNMSA